MDRIFLWLEKWFLGLLIFLIPTNLFLKGAGSVQGINVDYLMPKLYASDLAMAGLLLIVGLRYIRPIYRHLTSFKLNSTAIIVGLLSLSLIVSVAQSAQPIAGYWFLAKLVQMALFLVYLYQRAKLEWLTTPLVLTGLFQALIGVVQWFQRSSILGYMFFGETNLKQNTIVARTSITGEIRPLPYGTTPHPNILAGFLVVSLLILFYHWLSQAPKSRCFRYWSWRILVSLPLVATLLLSQSVSAILVLIVGIFLLLIQRLRPVTIFGLTTILVLSSLLLSEVIPQTSISRRMQLMEISQAMIVAEPLLGVGPNNFTARMSDFGEIYGNHRFLQPVHNIYLLWLAEVGVVNAALLGLLLYQLRHRWLSSLVSHHQVVPLLALGLIGLVDHYPLSLQTGMLLSTLSIWIMVAKWEKSPRQVKKKLKVK